MTASRGQSDLFALPPREVEAAPLREEHRAIAAALPPGIRLGTMSWSYPGWRGIVYGAQVAEQHLPDYGLTAYAKHPLLGAAEIDRTYYEPVTADFFRAFAAQVPEHFRFLAKAHEDCVVMRYPAHARYGKKRGEPNARFLDPAYATEAVVGPFAEGLGERAGALLFQFPPQDVGGPRAFADRLYRFLSRLPRDVRYAVEVRNAELLTPEYAMALADSGAVHCHNAWSVMPPVLAQAKSIPPRARSPLIIRWLLPAGETFEDARARLAPFDRIAEEDLVNREAIAGFAAKAASHGVPVLILVDNKAEGCAPETIVRLARAIVEKSKS